MTTSTSRLIPSLEQLRDVLILNFIQGYSSFYRKLVVPSTTYTRGGKWHLHPPILSLLELLELARNSDSINTRRDYTHCEVST